MLFEKTDSNGKGRRYEMSSRSFFWFTLLLAAGCSSSSGKCSPGKSGCACVQGTCDTGAVCIDTKCKPESNVGLTVGSDKARACEVLLGESGGKISRVDFKPSVDGRWLRQGGNVSAAITTPQ